MSICRHPNHPGPATYSEHETLYVAVQLNTVVSGALDRLHYEKDPCVKYDVSRKLWIYRHRSRAEDEFGQFSVHSRPIRACLALFPAL